VTNAATWRQKLGADIPSLALKTDAPALFHSNTEQPNVLLSAKTVLEKNLKILS